MWNNKKHNIVFPFVKLQTYYHFKLDFQNVNQHTGGRWLIHGTKRYNRPRYNGTLPSIHTSSTSIILDYIPAL